MISRVSHDILEIFNVIFWVFQPRTFEPIQNITQVASKSATIYVSKLAPLVKLYLVSVCINIYQTSPFCVFLSHWLIHSLRSFINQLSESDTKRRYNFLSKVANRGVFLKLIFKGVYLKTNETSCYHNMMKMFFKKHNLFEK